MFKWNKGWASVEASSIFNTSRGPSSFLIKSPKSGKNLKFSVDPEEAENAEFWDGEYSIYRDQDKKFAVQIWNY